jgi:hypothetical protein
MGTKDDLVDRQFLNKFGSYEDNDFMILNFKILAEAGELGHFKVRNDKKIKYLVKSRKKYIKALIKKKESDLWGWKDPSTIYTIPYLHKYLTNPYYIYLHRNIDDIINSILRVVNDFKNILSIINIYFRVLNLRTIINVGLNFFTEFIKRANPIKVRTFLHETISNMYNKIEGFLKNKRHLSIQLEDLVQNSKQIVDKIIKFLTINPSKEQISTALAFLHPELLHTHKE